VAEYLAFVVPDHQMFWAVVGGFPVCRIPQNDVTTSKVGS